MTEPDPPGSRIARLLAQQNRIGEVLRQSPYLDLAEALSRQDRLLELSPQPNLEALTKSLEWSNLSSAFHTARLASQASYAFARSARLCRYRHSLAERALRGPVIGRRLSFGSDSETGARFTALMYSVVATLATNGIDVRRWLGAWLRACAANGGRAPQELSPWLPWSMSEERRRTLLAPG